LPSLAQLFTDALAVVPAALATFGKHLKVEWIEKALSLSGNAVVRRRKLPLDRALWLVIGMGLFRDRSIHEVVEHLDLALPSPQSGVAPSAIPQARERLGVEPVQCLFELTGEEWTRASVDENRWRGLSLWGLDGTCMRVPDTAENEAEFGRPRSGRSKSGYPQVRLVSLLALRSRILAGMSIGSFHQGEMTLVDPLWTKIPDHSLSIVDRGFLSWGALYLLHAKGSERHWLLRAKAKLKWRRVKRLGPGDELVEIKLPRKARKAHPEMPASFIARVVRYQRKGYPPQKLISSAVDAEKYPRNELVELYHERWEIELAYDEIKTHMLEREESLRSKKPEGVRQELLGIGIAYNLVRVEMERVAREEGLEPCRISFRHALVLIRNFCVNAWNMSPGVLPRRLGSLERDLRLLVLPARRSERSYPRHVKIKMSNYARNRGKSARAA
jgi:hypothetical protein